MIANCSCSSCHAHHHGVSHVDAAGGGDGDGASQHPTLMDVPELMGLMRQVQTRKLAANQSAEGAAAAEAYTAAAAAAAASVPALALQHPHLQGMGHDNMLFIMSLWRG